MNGLDMEKLLSLQSELQEKYKNKWGSLMPEKAKNMLLWLVGEVGEVADIIKKNGDKMILSNSNTRGHFIEEMADVMMYFCDVLLCYGITAEEFERVYLEKHDENMNRW